MAKRLPAGIKSMPVGISYQFHDGRALPHRFVVRDPNTSKRTTRCFASPKEGLGWADTILAGNKAGTIAPGHVLWKDAGADYVGLITRGNRRPVFIAAVQRIVDALTEAGAGDLKSERFPEQVKQWLDGDGSRQLEGARLEGEPASPATYNRRIAIIRAVVRHATLVHRIPFNPLGALRMAKVPKREMETLHMEELMACLHPSRESDPYFLRFAILAYTGVRDTEGLHLHWDDYDVKRQAIRIVAKPFYDLKTGERTIPVMDELAAILAPLRLKGATGYILPDSLRLTEDGKAVVGDKTDYDRFRHYLRNSGVTRWETLARPRHSMRHLFARLMSATGVMPSTLQHYLGHTDPATTAIYAAGSHLYEKAVAGWAKGEFQLRRAALAKTG